MTTNALVIRGGQLLDGTGNRVEDGAVLIRGSKIEAVGPEAEVDVQAPEDDRVIDAGGGTIMPGLVDAHVHLNGTRSMNVLDWVVEPAQVKVARTVADCRRLLDAGFTAVRDAGGFGIFLKRAIADGSIEGPRIVSSYRTLSQTGGHGDVHFLPLRWVREAEGLSRICDGPDDCRKAAREQFREGADYIKICTTGGVMSEKDTPEASQFTLDEIRAIVEEAERVGSFVASHAQGAAGIKNALKAGVKTIEHGFYLDDEACRMMVDNDRIFVPTLAIMHMICERGADHGTPEYALAKARAARRAHDETVRRAHEAGVKIALGTDFCGPELIPHGKNALELELLVESGLTPMEAIVAGTRVAAEALGLADSIGTLERGKEGDVIVVDGDPLADIGVLCDPANVRTVVLGGRVVKG